MTQSEFILSLVILMLLGGMLYLVLGLKKLRRQHKQQVGELEKVIVSLTAQSGHQLEQLELSDQLMERLRQARVRLDTELIGLQEDYARLVAQRGMR